MPKAWPPLTAEQIGACFRRLGWILDRQESSHQVWINEATHRVAIVDVKWNPVSSRTLQHLVEVQAGLSREAFYSATKTTAKKINLRLKR